MRISPDTRLTGQAFGVWAQRKARLRRGMYPYPALPPIPVVALAPTLTPSSGEVGVEHVVSGDTWDAYDDRQYRILVDGVEASDTDSYTPTPEDDGLAMVGEARARNKGGFHADWVATDPVIINIVEEAP